MIQYFKHEDIDKTKWDNCIDNSINNLIYAYSWYLDLVCEDWDALVEDDYISVFPLTFSTKAGISYLHQPPFCQQLGIFSTRNLSAQRISSFLRNIPHHFKLIEINLNKFNRIEDNSFITKLMRNYELDLISDYRQIFRAYSDNHRRNIEKAKESGLVFQKGIIPELVIELFRKNKGDVRKLYNGRIYRKLQRLIYELIHKGRAEVWGVRNQNNELLAGACFLITANRIIFLFSGRDNKAKEKGAMHLLIDECILQFSGRQMIFDFEGSNDEGLGRFYAGFGAKATMYLQLYINRLPFMYKTIFFSLKRIKSLF
jgi:hypothetical protein